MSGIKSFGFIKKISFLSHLLKARLNLETAHVEYGAITSLKIGERISLERFAPRRSLSKLCQEGHLELKTPVKLVGRERLLLGQKGLSASGFLNTGA